MICGCSRQLQAALVSQQMAEQNREIQRQLEKEQNLDDSERLLAYQKERDDLKKQMDTERKRQQAHRMALSERISYC